MAIWIHLGSASWTYSCELLRYSTIPSQSWREPLEPGAAPTTPDDWPTAPARSLTRVRLYTSEGLWSWTTERKSWTCTFSHKSHSLCLTPSYSHKGPEIIFNRLSLRRTSIKQFIQEPLRLIYTHKPDVLFHSGFFFFC